MNFKLDTKNKLYVSFYTGADNFLTKETVLGWSNYNGSVRWNKIHTLVGKAFKLAMQS